jgi:hypothetical protein
MIRITPSRRSIRKLRNGRNAQRGRENDLHHDEFRCGDSFKIEYLEIMIYFIAPFLFCSAMETPFILFLRPYAQ